MSKYTNHGLTRSKFFLKATEEEIEEAGGRPIEPEAGGVLTGYKKVETSN